MIKVDGDDEIVKIDEEVHDEFNLLFSNFMSIYEGNHDDPSDESDPPHVELGDASSMTLNVFPLASYLPSIYDEQDWDVDDLL